MEKVSFDFDSTLDKPSVQNYAKMLVSKGYEVWICTSRVPTELAFSSMWNDDLFAVADEVGIKRDNIKFCQHEDKYIFLKGKNFMWHLDDDNYELELINKHCKPTKGISVWGNKNWIKKCSKLLGIDVSELMAR